MQVLELFFNVFCFLERIHKFCAKIVDFEQTLNQNNARTAI